MAAPSTRSVFSLTLMFLTLLARDRAHWTGKINNWIACRRKGEGKKIPKTDQYIRSQTTKAFFHSGML